jgi:hypothetical protein
VTGLERAHRFHEDYAAPYSEQFNALQEKLDACNNVAILQSIKPEADTLKTRLLASIADREALSPPPERRDAQSDDAPVPIPSPSPPPAPKYLNIREAVSEQTWQIRSEAEMDAYLAGLRERIKRELKDGTTLHIEF